VSTSVVTEAASGIGRATALHLARDGCDPALLDIDQPGLGETKRTIEGAGGVAGTFGSTSATRTNSA
jgi:NAD(P)-dependent dehydrogenase (short-subunit alcohol dehydrogenase family)